MYRYMGSSQTGTTKPAALTQYNFRNDAKIRKIISNFCNPPQDILIGVEGIVEESLWALQGVLVVMRHGDRGPLNHVRSGNTLNCAGVQPSNILKGYKKYILNATDSGKAVWAQTPGPFHGFPVLPSGASCHLGQLTALGVDQVLRTGLILREAYSSRLEWSAGSVVVFSTRYRRTFQSALALLWAALPEHTFLHSATALQESHSVTFCFRECACPAAEALVKNIGAAAKRRIDAHPAIVELVKKMSTIVFQRQTRGDAEVLKDALLAYLCHPGGLSSLPCVRPSHLHTGPTAYRPDRYIPLHADLDAVVNNNFDIKAQILRRAHLDFDTEMEKEKLHYYQKRFTDHVEPHYEDAQNVRRSIDEDFKFNSDTEGVKLKESLDTEKEYDAEDRDEGQEESGCINEDHVASLFAFVHWNVRQNVRSSVIKKKAILNAYGLIHNIVQNMLKMISEGIIKLVLYSGHDKTIQALILALGLSDYNHYNVHYSSRAVFEVYRKVARDLNTRAEVSAQDFYFRLVLNGADVTDQLVFCRNGRTVIQNTSFQYDQNNAKSNRYYLCPIENIVRFIHDDYFAVFNASNYKDACTVH